MEMEERRGKGGEMWLRVEMHGKGARTDYVVFLKRNARQDRDGEARSQFLSEMWILLNG